jgi:uncharacterized protein YegL
VAGTSTISTGEQVHPLYILLDESTSMPTIGGIDVLNSALPELHASLSADPAMARRVHIGVVAFSDTAEEIVTLTPAADLDAFPGLQSGGQLRYGAAFRLLRQIILRDVADLKQRGCIVLRQLVLFVSAGRPEDDWEQDYDALVEDPAARPNIVAFGICDADPSIIERIASIAGYVAVGRAEMTPILTEVAQGFFMTTLRATTSSQSFFANLAQSSAYWTRLSLDLA